MKKRTSRDKGLKGPVQRRVVGRERKGRSQASPLFTQKLLINRTQCLNSAKQFEKSRIERIVRGSNLAAIQFRQVEKNCTLEEYLARYYQFEDVRSIFTDLITRSSLVEDITFVDFKLRHFKIMNHYDSQRRQLSGGRGKAKDENKQKTRYLSEMQLGGGGVLPSRTDHSHNASSSSIQLLAKNIQKMIKHIHDPGCLSARQMDSNPLLHKNPMNTPDISNIYQERIHTTPEPMAVDAYGLGEFCHSAQRRRKMEEAALELRSGKQSHGNCLRFQTEYDTEYLTGEKVGKGRKKGSESRRSFSKKGLSKGKSPLGLKCGLKLKK